MYGFGRGRHFMAYLNAQHCNHCNNTSRWQLYSNYYSEMLLGVTEFSYTGVDIVCPVCEFGNGISFHPFNSRMTKIFGSSKTKKDQEDAVRAIAELLAAVDIPETYNYFCSLGWINKRRYKAMLNQLKQGAFLVHLLHG